MNISGSERQCGRLSFGDFRCEAGTRQYAARRSHPEFFLDDLVRQPAARLLKPLQARTSAVWGLPFECAQSLAQRISVPLPRSNRHWH
jgi:hypothetical protein